MGAEGKAHAHTPAPLVPSLSPPRSLVQPHTNELWRARTATQHTGTHASTHRERARIHTPKHTSVAEREKRED
jgi:hypothetical protein